MGKALITTIRDLQRRRGRERRGLALAEGVRLVEEALAAGVQFRGAAISPALQATTRGQALEAALAAHGVSLETIPDGELTELADTEHPQGVIAVIEPRDWTLDDIPLTGSAAVLVLDGVQDPGNLGAIVRTAYALGAAGVIALKGTADLTNPKALRGGMGAAFRLPCVAAEDEAFDAWCATGGATLWVADAAGTSILQASARPPSRPLALVLGNEGGGVRPSLAARADLRVAIPLRPGAESLNVAVAAGILLYEVLRER